MKNKKLKTTFTEVKRRKKNAPTVIRSEKTSSTAHQHRQEGNNQQYGFIN